MASPLPPNSLDFPIIRDPGFPFDVFGRFKPWWEQAYANATRPPPGSRLLFLLETRNNFFLVTPEVA